MSLFSITRGRETLTQTLAAIMLPPSDFREWHFRGSFADGDPLSPPPISVAEAENLLALIKYHEATEKK